MVLIERTSGLFSKGMESREATVRLVVLMLTVSVCACAVLWTVRSELGEVSIVHVNFSWGL